VNEREYNQALQYGYDAIFLNSGKLRTDSVIAVDTGRIGIDKMGNKLPVGDG